MLSPRWSKTEKITGWLVVGGAVTFIALATHAAYVGWGWNNPSTPESRVSGYVIVGVYALWLVCDAVKDAGKEVRKGLEAIAAALPGRKGTWL